MYYPGRDADLSWLTMFLSSYPPDYALAEITGAHKDDYTATYPDVVARMKKQPLYPVRFMQLNPDGPAQQAYRAAVDSGERAELTDGRWREGSL